MDPMSRRPSGSVPASGGAFGTIALPNTSASITPSCSRWFSPTLPTVSRARLFRSIGGPEGSAPPRLVGYAVADEVVPGEQRTVTVECDPAHSGSGTRLQLVGLRRQAARCSWLAASATFVSRCHAL